VAITSQHGQSCGRNFIPAAHIVGDGKTAVIDRKRCANKRGGEKGQEGMVAIIGLVIN